MEHSAEDWIEALNLQPHPEGGYYRQTYRDEKHQFQPEGSSDLRSASTAIYFLMTVDSFSAFHRIKSDELWHFHTGAPMEIFWIDAHGELVTEKLGISPEQGYLPQRMIPANHWFAARICQHNTSPCNYALVGCTVAPGFDFADFELADDSLIEEHPQYAECIRQLIR